MLSPVSMASVSKVRPYFGEGEKSNADILSRQGAYAKQPEAAPASATPAKEKKSHTGRNILIGALAVVAAAASLVALHKTNVLKVLPEAELKDLKFYDFKKMGHYLAKAGEFIGKYTYEPLVGLYNKWFNKAAK